MRVLIEVLWLRGARVIRVFSFVSSDIEQIEEIIIRRYSGKIESKDTFTYFFRDIDLESMIKGEIIHSVLREAVVD